MTKQSIKTPPQAPRRPHAFTTHGIALTDDYAWLKDQNWQDVLRDPAILDRDIRAYLEAENTYTESLLGHTAPLQKTLVKECGRRGARGGVLMLAWVTRSSCRSQAFALYRDQSEDC